MGSAASAHVASMQAIATPASIFLIVTLDKKELSSVVGRNQAQRARADACSKQSGLEEFKNVSAEEPKRSRRTQEM